MLHQPSISGGAHVSGGLGVGASFVGKISECSAAPSLIYVADEATAVDNWTIFVIFVYQNPGSRIKRAMLVELAMALPWPHE